MTPVILPPGAGTATPAVAPGGHPAVHATAPDAPPAAARLEAGSVITGTVLGRDAQGLVAIRTDRGVLALQTNANLPVGAQVSLEVRVAGTRLQLVVLSVELPAGQSPMQPQAGGTPPVAAGAGLPAPLPTAPQAAVPPLTPAAALAFALGGGGLVMATVVHSTHAGASGQPAGTLPPPAAQALTGRLLPGQPLPEQPPQGQTLPGQANPGQSAPGQSAAARGNPPQSPLGQGLSVPPAVPGAPGAVPGGAHPALQKQAGVHQVSVPQGTVTQGTVTQGTAAQGTVTQGTVTQGLPDAQNPTGTAPAATGARLLQGLLSGAPIASAPAGPAASLPQPLAPGSEIGVRIVSAALPGTPAPVPGLPAAPGAVQVPATVVAHAPNGQPVVETPLGPMVLAVKGALPTGATLIVELPAQPHLADPALGPPVTSAQQALVRLFRGWPALGNVLAAFGAAGDMASAQALAAKLPHTGPRLAAGLMSLIQQFAAGETGDLLAPALREALEKIGKRDLADRLNGEFRQIGRLAGEPAGGDWRVMFLPLRHDGELHQVNLYLRGRRRNGERDGQDTGTRFVVEVDMTRLGPIQLDGLVHGRRFDLMLRSRMPLAAAVRRDIEAIFDEARGLGGFAGTIGFQVAASFPVQPLEQAKRKNAAGGVVV